MEFQKKKRSENWSPEEKDSKDILRELIAQSAHIIEDKSTKTTVNILKVKEWKNISNKFNEITGKHRTVEEMKLAWKRMKLSAKSNLSTHRRESIKTGGGEKPPSPSHEDLAIMAIAPHDFVIEVNDYDSDAMTHTVLTENIIDYTDPKPGPSRESIMIIDDTINMNISEQIVAEVQDNQPKINTRRENETSITTKNRNKKEKGFQNRNDSERHTIVQSNIDFKKRHLEMMEEEHQFNIKIAKLKIKKLELEISILESNKNNV